MKISSISEERIGLPERSLGRHYRKRAKYRNTAQCRFKKFYPFLLEGVITILIIIFVLGLWKISGMYEWWIHLVGRIV